MPVPAVGGIRDADLEPAQRHEQGGFRPVLVSWPDTFNQTPHGLCIAVPLTRTDRGVRSHIRLEDGLAGPGAPSVIMCEQVRSVSVDRLERRGEIVGSNPS